MNWHWPPAPVVVFGYSLVYQPFYWVAAFLVGHVLLTRRAELYGSRREAAGEFSLTLIAAGFLGSHLLPLVLYPALWRQDPWRWLRYEGGLSSEGVILGALVGGIALVFWKGPAEVLRLGDHAAFAFPITWMLIRTACLLTQNHPGIRTNHWLGVNYLDGKRFDMALLELLFAAVLLLVFLLANRQAHWAGFYLGMAGAAFGCFRLGVMHLREAMPDGSTDFEPYVAASIMVVGLAMLAISTILKLALRSAMRSVE